LQPPQDGAQVRRRARVGSLRVQQLGGLPPGECARTHRDQGEQPLLGVAQRTNLRADIRGILAIRDSGEPPCSHVTALISGHLEQIEQRLAQLELAQAALRALSRRAASTAPAECTDDDICRILMDPPT
jgi:MerR family transcriptional regulator, copper efflux regulator